MNISDMIAMAINEIIDKQGGIAQFKRNEIADKLGCVPSQINYVITSRFTMDNGYIVESRRGGGGFIQIEKINLSNKDLLLHIINSIGNRIDEKSIRIILQKLVYDNLVQDKEVKMIMSATNDNILRSIPYEYRDISRALIFKSMLMVVVKD